MHKDNKLDKLKDLPDAKAYENNKITHKVDWLKINVSILLVVLGISLGILIILLIAFYK